MAYALLMTESCRTSWASAWAARHVDRRPRPRPGARRGIGALPGLHHRLHRRAVIHRHARWTAVAARRRLGAVERSRGHRPRRRRSCCSVGRRRDRSGATATWVVAIAGCVGDHGLLVYNRRQRRRFGFPLRPMWAEVLSGSPVAWPCSRFAAVANANYWPPGLAEGCATSNGIVGRRRAEDLVGHLRGRSSSSSGSTRDDLHRHPPKVRALRLRLRRKPGSRGAGWHQHALDHHEDVHADGPAVRDRRGGRIGKTERRDTRHRGRATSSTSSPRPSSAGHPSRAGSGRCRARSLAPRDAVARIRIGVHRRGLADPERRGRHRPGRGGRLRHRTIAGAAADREGAI